MVFEQPQLWRELGAVSAQRPALPEGWVASVSSRRRLGGFAEMTEKRARLVVSVTKASSACDRAQRGQLSTSMSKVLRRSSAQGR
jgi:hypothetical protein